MINLSAPTYDARIMMTTGQPQWDEIKIRAYPMFVRMRVEGGGGQIDHRCMRTMLRPLPFLMEILALGLNLLYIKVQCSLYFRNFPPEGKLCFPRRRHISLLNDAERKCTVERRVY